MITAKTKQGYCNGIATLNKNLRYKWFWDGDTRFDLPTNRQRVPLNDKTYICSMTFNLYVLLSGRHCHSVSSQKDRALPLHFQNEADYSDLFLCNLGWTPEFSGNLFDRMSRYSRTLCAPIASPSTISVMS